MRNITIGDIVNKVVEQSVEKIKTMEINLTTKVVHSETKPAWNVAGTKLGHKYKIAKCPYQADRSSPILDTRERKEAFEHATFISECFNKNSK